MPPSRRRGAAGKAAAARRQWKVGDLVLAKVKGFPAWPATVSEPAKWGYSADWKKVLVYFFGTQQIGFCNPADVEAFTEEKKQSLLVKRQGKGADFVRAVQEIIDSYENSKKHDQVDDCNSVHEVTPKNGGNSLESSAHFDTKDRAETSEATVTGRNDSSLPAEDAPSEAPIAFLKDKEAIAGQPVDGVVGTRGPIITTYTSRKRSGLRSRKIVAQKKAPPVERSRSSSRLDPYRFENMMPFNDGNKSSVDASTNVIRDGSLRRSKRIRKSPEAADWDDVDSSAFASNRSIEDDGSEVVTMQSDSFSLSESSATDSGCKVEHSESLCECLEGDIELSKELDFQIRASVIKKRRKLNRKGVTNEVSEPKADLEVGEHNISQNLENACENLSTRHNREDGDEHLPLVKRARVRMNKSSNLEEQHNILSEAEEKLSNEIAVISTENNFVCQAQERISNEATANMLEHITSSKNCNDDFPADQSSLVVNTVLDNASSLKNCSQILGDMPQVSTSKEYQSLCCPADGEAALPPSKRLHRALEAMSANAAEGHKLAERSTMKTEIDADFTSMMASHVVVESKDRNGSGELTAHSLGGKASIFCTNSSTFLEEAAKSSLEADICNQPIESLESEKYCKDVFPEARDHDDGKGPIGPCIGTCPGAVVKAKSPVHLTHNLGKGPVGVQSNWGLMDRLLPMDEENSEISLRAFEAENPGKELDTTEHSGTRPKFLMDEGNSEIRLRAVEAEKPGKELDTSEHSRSSPQLMIRDDEYAKVAPQTVHENTESLRSHIDDNAQASDMHEVAKHVKHGQGQKEAICVSASGDHLDDKCISSIQSNPFPTDVNSSAHICPPMTSLCCVSTSESANNQNRSCSSPNVHSHLKKTSVTDEKIKLVVPQKPKFVGKMSNYAEAHAALSSFERTLGSLTRTKDSISRATRVAIDCAKLGITAKVVEILAQSLENESGLRRRVDLFFLVDSIIQCSRGLKGDIGCIYPSAILAVLPRLLSAAAPPGGFALENRRQCMKVLRLWLERKVLPESVICHHIRELDSINTSSSAGPYSRRSARTERSLDDPVRDMEGMLVDEYGSNSSFQLPGFCMPRMLKDEDERSDSDGGSFEAVTPEHNFGTFEEQESNLAAEKHTHILEDVDGELEMEDVAPSCEVEMNSINCDTLCTSGSIAQQNYHEHFEECLAHPFAPPLPHDMAPSLPPLPSSPPPPPPLPSLPLLPSASAPALSCSMQDDSRQSLSQQQAVPRINESSAGHYVAAKCTDQLQMQHCDSTNSFSNYPVHQVNNVHCNDGPRYHHKAHPQRQLHPPPSDQFSYVQAGEHMKSRREIPPPPYSHRFHSSHGANGRNFYRNRERMRPAPYEHNENWRYPAPFTGPRYHDKPKASYAPSPYGGGPCEPNRLPHGGWDLPPQGMHHRNFMPFRPPSEAPSIWQPR